jgi:hypothetical protein
MHLVWIGLGIIAPVCLIFLGFLCWDLKKQERIAKDREDHGW